MKLTTSNKAILQKLDNLGEDHDMKLQLAKKTTSEQNVTKKLLLDKREKALSVQVDTDQGSQNTAELNKEMKEQQSSSHPGYVISFDNIDLQLKRRNMTSSQQNQDLHWINHKMVENRVSANHLDSLKPKADILDVENIKFLPSVAEHEKQRMDYVILTSRILIKHFSILLPLKDVCIQHIPHRYSKEMSQKSNKVL